MNTTKICVIGCGHVGSTIAYSLATLKVAHQLVLIDINKSKAVSEQLDITHSLHSSYTKVLAGGYEDIRDSNIIIVSGGVGRKPGETRFDLLSKNAAIAKDIASSIKEYYNSGVIIVISNPVDIITYVIHRELGLPRGTVLGTGTLLDTIRFQCELSQYFGVNVNNISAYVLGVHGEHIVPVYSMANICGINVAEYALLAGKRSFEADTVTITNRVKEAGASIIAGKGATYYGISGAIIQLIEAIMHDAKTILPLTAVLDGEYGFCDSATGLLGILGNNGAERFLTPKLNAVEAQQLDEAVRHTESFLKRVNFPD